MRGEDRPVPSRKLRQQRAQRLSELLLERDVLGAGRRLGRERILESAIV